MRKMGIRRNITKMISRAEFIARGGRRVEDIKGHATWFVIPAEIDDVGGCEDNDKCLGWHYALKEVYIEFIRIGMRSKEAEWYMYEADKPVWGCSKATVYCKKTYIELGEFVQHCMPCHNEAARDDDEGPSATLIDGIEIANLCCGMVDALNKVGVLR